MKTRKNFKPLIVSDGTRRSGVLGSCVLLVFGLLIFFAHKGAIKTGFAVMKNLQPNAKIFGSEAIYHLLYPIPSAVVLWLVWCVSVNILPLKARTLGLTDQNLALRAYERATTISKAILGFTGVVVVGGALLKIFVMVEYKCSPATIMELVDSVWEWGMLVGQILIFVVAVFEIWGLIF